MKNICVFFGGQSVEHDISVLTGVMTVNSVDKQKYNAIPIFVSRSGEWFTGERLLDVDGYKNLDQSKLNKVCFLPSDNCLYQVNGKKLKKLCAVSAVLNCMHGERGEDGSLAGYFNMVGIPFASPDVLSSAVSMDKRFTKIAMKGINVKTLPCKVITDLSECESLAKDLTFPVIVKPTMLGSSIGITRADNKDQLFSAVSYALRYGQSAIIEQLLENFMEINCSAYLSENGVNVSECERPVARGGVLTFSDKYVSGKREFPANISKKYSDKIKSITKKVYEKLGFFGVIRIDYFISDGEIYLNEINSVPGSLAYYLFHDTLKGFTKMLSELIETCLIRTAKIHSIEKVYHSGVLGMLTSKGGKACKNKQ